MNPLAVAATVVEFIIDDCCWDAPREVPTCIEPPPVWVDEPDAQEALRAAGGGGWGVHPRRQTKLPQRPAGWQGVAGNISLRGPPSRRPGQGPGGCSSSDKTRTPGAPKKSSKKILCFARG